MAGLVLLVVGTLLLGIALAPVLYLEDILRAWRRLRERRSPPPPAPDGPAIEVLARSLRRLRAEVRSPRPGTTMARRRGTAAAYDDLLAQAARALGVPDALTGLPEGTDRGAERLRLEDRLCRAGLVLD